MNTVLKIPFSKLHGLGNDWIVVEHKQAGGLPAQSWPEVARSVCDRHTGVGADGLIVAVELAGRRRPAHVHFFNADGSHAEMSGNGIRCVGAYLLENAARKRSRSVPQSLQIETVAGVKTLDVVSGGAGVWTFRVAMGAPILNPAAIPFNGVAGDGPVLKFPLEVEGRTLPVTVTSMGNPHCSLFLDDLGIKRFEEVDWAALGARIERHPMFPNRTNVEFVKRLSGSEIEVRFWERGVGSTQSSGTGSCGAVVASILNGLTRPKVRVRTQAGSLDVAWPKGGQVMLTGPAALVAEGVYQFRKPSTGRSGRGRTAAKRRL